MRKKVLVVDDEENLLKLVCATLGYDDSYEIAVARDGEEAIAVAARTRPDLVILDMLMPKLDGPAVCRSLKADVSTAHTKIIILTALAQQSARQMAMASGADDFITKPFSPTVLLRKVEEMLGTHS